MLSFFLAAMMVSSGGTAPIPCEMVDMTYTFDETTLHYPSQRRFEMKVTMNQTTEEGYWLQLEEYRSAIHVGTHMDAPCHFAKGRWCVDDIPVDRLVAPAAVVDITEKADKDSDALVERKDLEAWEALSGKSLNGTVVVMRSGWGRRWGDKEAFTGTPDNDTTKLHSPGLSPKAAQWLVSNRDIVGVATETLSIDNGPSQDFRSHRILYDANIYGLENVANVEEIPLVGATLHVMPMKIGRGSGAPTRIVATFPKVVTKPKGPVTEGVLREVIIFNK